MRHAKAAQARVMDGRWSVEKDAWCSVGRRRVDTVMAWPTITGAIEAVSVCGRAACAHTLNHDGRGYFTDGGVEEEEGVVVDVDVDIAMVFF
mmetsp:Transcript_32291/g.47367  ORF Transcript_32291/g.47367 Transcript_32291/m.47367 type:complete len:92 (-) Transcript_32291:18-293(-)